MDKEFFDLIFSEAENGFTFQLYYNIEYQKRYGEDLAMTILINKGKWSKRVIIRKSEYENDSTICIRKVRETLKLIDLAIENSNDDEDGED